ncbi:hypothetical protein AX16_009553 [Volvariella volvacea WC 439]|nr:hypothetical protein AX16_009553 [Volvariella volvacea WC 439]
MPLSNICRLVPGPTASNPVMNNTHISIPLGIAIGLLASFVQSLGLTIQRKSHVINQSLPEHKQLVEHRRPLWLLGFAIFISSNLLGSLVQIAALPVVILAPLGAVSLLWNAFFARLLLGDVFSPWMILGTLLIAGGAVLIAVFGIVPEQTRSLEDLLALFRRPTFVAYFSVLGVVVFICLAITHVTEFSLSRKLTRPVSPHAPPGSTPSSLTLHALAHESDPVEVADSDHVTESTPLLLRKAASSNTHSTIQSLNNTRLILAISYASFSGIISGMCLLFAKSGVELLLVTLRGQNQFWRWQAWVLILSLALFALLQLWYLHKALVYADPTLVCPSAFCFYNVSSIVNGLVYFDQFSLIPLRYLTLVILGMVILLCGVWVVSIQSGSGVVDVAAWTETDNLGVNAVNTASQGDDTTAQRIGPRSPRSQVPRAVRPHSYGDTLSTSPDTIPLGATPESRASSIREGLSGRKVAHHRRPTIDLSLPLHARPSPHTHTHPHHTQSPPLIGTGLQIGLSPVSPGFAILPKERRRRVSGMMESPRQDLEDLHVDGDRFDGLQIQPRRAVSEGDAGEAESAWRRRPTDSVSGQGQSAQNTVRMSRGEIWSWMGRVFTSS